MKTTRLITPAALVLALWCRAHAQENAPTPTPAPPPASVYPLEIVQAARFVADTNNLAKLDAQPWDDSVKAVARVPDAIKKMNEDLSWTMELGDAFLAQDKDVMDAIQSMREKAQK